MNRKRTAGYLFGVIALSLVSFAWAGGIYKWVDEQGVTHFGEKPPAPGVGEKIRVSVPSSSSSPVPEAKASPVPAPAPTPKDTAEDKAQAEITKKNCEIYSANLKVLQEHGRIKEQAADGQMKILADEEKQKRIQQAEKFLAEHCQGQKK